MFMNWKTIPYVVLIVLLAGSTLVLGMKTIGLQKELVQTRAALAKEQTNVKIVDFTRLFTEKVLKADAEVDFETRLQLENAIRDLNDKEILAQWEKFVGSKTEGEAQENVKDLLSLLVGKIRV
ncbi:hypothetical protein EPO33_03620 [Patescibacteria group bacterium]|nr:MAG: hypothetical protein EPO33_03620 [Patescibacteria group bacterium]